MLLTTLDKLELALSLARASSPQPLACQLLQAAARFLDLCRPPNYVQYNPGPTLRRALETSAQLSVEPTADAVGDTAQIAAIIRLLIQSARLEQDAELVIDVFQQPDKIQKEGVPCVALAFEGFGSFPTQFSFGGDGMTLTFDELQVRWTVATHGGRIDQAPNGLLLRLTGVRTIPEPEIVPEPVRAAVAQAALACDHDIDTARIHLDQALAVIDGPAAPELADIKAIVHDVAREHQPQLESQGVVFEPMFGADLPPIPVRRNAIRSLFKRILAYAIDADSPGAAVSILFDYDIPRRAVVFVTTIAGVQTVPTHAAIMASLRRTVVDLHGGAFETSSDTSEVTLTISLPDPVGRTIEGQFPGFDSFSGQSRKILRLLYSGAPTPPRELLLQGILEEELARWLIPQLETPAAINVAHEIAQDPKLKPLASPERLKKALDQIQKGKPKREIARLPFAAEIVWAYKSEPRRRAALAANNLSQSDLEHLAKSLTAPPTTETLPLCLQLLAKRAT